MIRVVGKRGKGSFKSQLDEAASAAEFVQINCTSGNRAGAISAKKVFPSKIEMRFLAGRENVRTCLSLAEKLATCAVSRGREHSGSLGEGVQTGE